MNDINKFQGIVSRYKTDKESVYTTWFVNGQERLKAFRAIRRGVEEVIEDIKQGRFGNDFKGSSLEVVLNSITEQKQVFEGAAHAFYWKPKLRIPDIYENDSNKIAFGQFLESCLNAKEEDQILREILQLSRKNIKGLGPAVANILYFIHPTIVPPFNTAMLRGFNLLFNENRKLGSWDEYLSVRETILRVNGSLKNLLSTDLGAISGMLYEIGTGRLVIDENAELVVEKDRKKLDSVLKTRHKDIQADLEEEESHTKVQYLLLKMGKSLGYDVIAAINDRSKSCEAAKFSFLSLQQLPEMGIGADLLRTIELIDVLWLHKGKSTIAAAFEVEKSTSIYSGILRLTDLALTFSDLEIMICLVAPDGREKEIIAQLKRPSLSKEIGARISYILFSDLCDHCESICKLGNDYTILEKIARRVGQ